MNMQVLDAGRDASGGYKVDVSRGERNGRVSSEWFNRPDDERYLSLDDLWANVKGRSERSRSRVVQTADIRVEAARDSAERLHLILPKATIIDVRREPMACGFSNLKQLFGTTNQEFTYGVDDIARHYRTYLDLMRHWGEVLPGHVLRVSYEDLVEDLEGGVRRMLTHAGLPFEPACLNFHETRRSVRTPSSEQVRQPLGRDGLTQWLNYAPWLEPLRQALGDAMIDYKD